MGRALAASTIVAGAVIAVAIGHAHGSDGVTMEAVRQTDTGLGALTVPAARLPQGCALRPAQSPLTANPATASDPALLRLILLFFPPVTEAERRARAAATDAATLESWLTARASAVVAGYAAFYREAGGSPEIGVYAVRLRTAPTEADATQFRRVQAGDPAGPRFIKGAVAIWTWSDARPEAPDRGCFRVVRDHLAQVEIR